MKAAAAVTSVDGLVEKDLVDGAAAESLRPVEEAFAVRLTPEVLQQIKALELGDPVFAQYVPQLRELDHWADELDDPIGDDAHEKVKGLVHRYPDRVLLKPTLTCAVYCRFCFRREKVGGGAPGLTEAEMGAALDYIAAHSEIREVILTGGDPLVLSPRRLEAIVARLAAIAHVKLLRFHTRVPLVEPQRISPALLKVLRLHPATRVVIHVNHEAEISPAVAEALAAMVDSGVPVLSQSVLLKGVNDDAATLAALFQRLAALRVSPYYLHHLDKARGTAHFRISLKKGRELMAALRGRISGFALPAYVIDIPGGFGKVPVNADHVLEISPGRYEIADPWGRRHRYSE
ncbi:MAG: lysine-2,3-aminomutase-like protein [Alphaproteobacteria bacterium]|nr:lysine-2,3-aminomutase-like protein [Alphaproteobacteria bacterium]